MADKKVELEISPELIIQNKAKKKKKKKKQKFNLQAFFYTLNIVFLLINFMFFFSLNKDFDKKIMLINDVANTYQNISREQINSFIKEQIKQDKIKDVINFYNNSVNNYEITYAIINNALQYKIPVNLLFGLIKHESGFNPKTKGAKNANGSFDFGLMQLNSITYQKLILKNGIDYVLDPFENLKLGCQHLVDCYDTYENWELALISYNAGNIKNQPVYFKTLLYLSKILSYEKEFDKKINEFIISK